MTSHVLAEGHAWRPFLERLEAAGLNDIYFGPAYVELYAGPEKRAEAFAFEQGDALFFMPYLLSPIHGPEGGASLYDVETAYGYGGPLATTDDPAFLAEAWAALADSWRGRGVICAFLRLHPLLDNHRFCQGGPVELVTDRETVTLNLRQEREAVWAGYSSGTRNKVRKGEKEGVSVTIHEDPEALAAFARLYETHMGELGAHDDYFFGDAYFQAVQRLGHGAWRVYLARHQDRVLGGTLILLGPRFAHYHLSSSLREYAHLSPNNMLRHAVSMDLLGGPWERLHFGGGRTGDPKDSLLAFKTGYSPDRAVFRFGKVMADPQAYGRLCDWWAETHPDQVARFGSRFLKYRYR